MVYLFYTVYISVDLANHEIFHAKVGKGGIKLYFKWVFNVHICKGQFSNVIIILTYMYFVYWLVVTNLYPHQKANCLAAYQLNKFSTLDPGVFVLLIIMFSCKSVKFGYLYQNCNVFTQFKESRVSL